MKRIYIFLKNKTNSRWNREICCLNKNKNKYHLYIFKKNKFYQGLEQNSPPKKRQIKSLI